jgi:hypothetical protein
MVKFYIKVKQIKYYIEGLDLLIEGKYNENLPYQEVSQVQIWRTISP